MIIAFTGLHQANAYHEQQDPTTAHLPAWRFIPSHQPHDKPEKWADQPVLVVRKSLHLPVPSQRHGLASVFRCAYAFHAIFACICSNPQGIAVT